MPEPGNFEGSPEVLSVLQAESQVRFWGVEYFFELANFLLYFSCAKI